MSLQLPASARQNPGTGNRFHWCSCRRRLSILKLPLPVSAAARRVRGILAIGCGAPDGHKIHNGRRVRRGNRSGCTRQEDTVPVCDVKGSGLSSAVPA